MTNGFRGVFPGALELVTLAARHSNDTMKRVDKFKQLLEIQENISGGPDLVSPTRELVKEGKICKISARSGDHQERYLFLVRPTKKHMSKCAKPTKS